MSRSLRPIEKKDLPQLVASGLKKNKIMLDRKVLFRLAQTQRKPKLKNEQISKKAAFLRRRSS